MVSELPDRKTGERKRLNRIIFCWFFLFVFFFCAENHLRTLLVANRDTFFPPVTGGIEWGLVKNKSNIDSRERCLFGGFLK